MGSAGGHQDAKRDEGHVVRTPSDSCPSSAAVSATRKQAPARRPGRRVPGPRPTRTGHAPASADTPACHAADAGWHVLRVSTADQREWDEFESTRWADRQEWRLAHPDDSHAQVVQQEPDAHLTEYAGTYRGLLGFCYLVLGYLVLGR